MRAWLKDTDWTLLQKANQQLCEKANVPHKISSATGKKAEAFWTENHTKKMTLEETMLFCKRMHFREPFINMNGNTLAAVALEAIDKYIPKTCTKSELEEAICTVVAGTVQGREEIILQNESLIWDPPKKEGPEME